MTSVYAMRYTIYEQIQRTETKHSRSPAHPYTQKLTNLPNKFENKYYANITY